MVWRQIDAKPSPEALMRKRYASGCVIVIAASSWPNNHSNKQRAGWWSSILHNPNTVYPISHEIQWWRHQMETFSALLDLCAGNSPVTGEFPSQRPMMRTFDVLFDLRLNKWLSSNQDAGESRHHRAHYDVTVMMHTILFVLLCCGFYFITSSPCVLFVW